MQKSLSAAKTLRKVPAAAGPVEGSREFLICSARFGSARCLPELRCIVCQRRSHAFRHHRADGAQELIGESRMTRVQVIQSKTTERPNDAGRDRNDLRHAYHFAEERWLAHHRTGSKQCNGCGPAVRKASVHEQCSRLDKKSRLARLTLPNDCISAAQRLPGQIGGHDSPVFSCETGAESVHGIERLHGFDERGDARYVMGCRRYKVAKSGSGRRYRSVDDGKFSVGSHAYPRIVQGTCGPNVAGFWDSLGLHQRAGSALKAKRATPMRCAT